MIEFPHFFDLDEYVRLLTELLGDATAAVVALTLSILVHEVFMRWIKQADSGEASGSTRRGDTQCPYCGAGHGVQAMLTHLVVDHGYSNEEAEIEVEYMLEQRGMYSDEARSHIVRNRG